MLITIIFHFKKMSIMSHLKKYTLPDRRPDSSCIDWLWTVRPTGGNCMEKRQNDLTGRSFGQLTVMQPTSERKNGYTVWRCQCTCGNEVQASSRHLKNGWARDCGCGPKRKKGADLTGQRFGRLLVLAQEEERGAGGQIRWRCQCNCGCKTITTTGQLRAGYKKSCGCLSHPPRKDWVGRQFGLLTVASYAGKWDGKHYWHCQCCCGCGRELDVSQSALLQGHTKSCKGLDRNQIQELAGQQFGDLTVLSYAGREGGRHYWRCVCRCGKETVVSQGNLKNGHTMSCGHRATPLTAKHFVEGTCIENIRSRKLFANNTSGIRGVYQNKRSGKWQAQITFQGKTRYLGSYDKLEDAAKARAAGEELFDEFLEKYDQDIWQRKE